VATTGKGRRAPAGLGPRGLGPRGLAAMLALGLLGAASAGCDAASPAAPSGAGPAATVPAAPSAAPRAWQRFCAAPAGASLRAALQRPVPVSLQDEVVPLGSSGDGRMAYVSTWTPQFSGVAALDLGTGQLRRIRAFPDPATDQADGSSGGRWLAWEETHSLQSLDGFTVYAWDSATGRLRRLGHSLPGPHGAPWPSPWHAPAVSGHYAAWAQGYGPGGEVEVMLADLATGKVSVVRRGHNQPPFFAGGLLVWPASDRPGAQTTLHAVSLRSGRAATLPAALRAVHGTEFVATDGTRTAYFSSGLTALYYSPAQDQRARVVLRLTAGADFAGLAIAPGSLAWTTTKATYLASTRTGEFTQVTPQYGDATGAGQDLIVSDAPGEKAAHPILPMHVIRPASLRWRPCSHRAA
jgi:hypothetical protein